MSLISVSSIKNGDIYIPFNLFACDSCETEVKESDPHIAFDNEHFCYNCAFVNELISEKEFLSVSGIYINNVHASVKDGKAVIWIGSKPPWEKSDKEDRNSALYSDWRKKVYERDNYTCTICGERGGELNAHHIKPFAKYKDLRFELSNGQTLCKHCHIEIHKEMRSGSID